MRKKYTKLCLVLATVSPIWPLQATECGLVRDTLDANWEKIRETSSASIYHLRRPLGNEATGTALVKWPFRPAQLFRIVSSYGRFPQFVPGVSHSVELRNLGHRVWVYQRLAFPAPLSDRHYIMVSDSGASQPQDNHYIVNWHLDDRFPLPKYEGAPVLPRKFQGCWDIRPSAAGGLNAIYSVEIDPGGLVPDWLARRAVQRYLADLMDALYRRLDTLSSSASEQ